MNMKEAMSAIGATSTTKNAAKDTSWGAYVHKTTSGMSTQDVADGKFKLIFVQRDGDQYVFTYGGTASPTYTYTGCIAKGASGAKGTGSPDPSTALELDATLMQAIIGDAWITGSLDNFEAARNGSGEW